MKSFSDVYAALRKKNLRQYALLAGCSFFSVLLITAYVSMMRSPTVLNVLPEGGDSRKQVMMIFVLAVLGCAVFVAYAAGLFFRHKSREAGVFLALGASRGQLKREMYKEAALLSVGSCAAGTLLGMPLAWAIWQLFRLTLVDTQEMVLAFDPQALLYALVFSLYVVAMLFVMVARFIRRTNIIDVVNESRKSEPIRDVPRWYGPVGILLMLVGAVLGTQLPGFLITTLHWYPPDWLTAPAYLPAVIGLYMILLHTVVNGWRKGKNRYNNIISTSMMKFQGRQTVRNMLVITVLIVGAYFGAFYTPMLGTSSVMANEARPVDYAFRYRADQSMLGEEEIRAMAAEEGVAVTSFVSQPVACLGVDGNEHIENTTSLGTTYDLVYTELLQSNLFLSESAYNALTGAAIDLAPGQTVRIHDDEGYLIGDDGVGITRVTNTVTGLALPVTQLEEPLRYSMLYGRYVLDDSDYAQLTQGLTADWLEQQVFFNTEKGTDTYAFAKRLFYEIVDRSGPEVEVFDSWDPIVKERFEQRGEAYFLDQEVLAANGQSFLDYNQRDSSEFRMYWKYMPQFRVLDKADFVKSTAVFLMLFIFIAIVCFAAVIVIACTRSITIAFTGAQIYDDLRHLGASNAYLYRTVKKQVSKVFFVPILAGTVIIYAFYAMIMFFNDGGSFSSAEIAGLFNCLLLIAAVSILFYCVYRLTLRRVCNMLNISQKPGKTARKAHS